MTKFFCDVGEEAGLDTSTGEAEHERKNET